MAENKLPVIPELDSLIKNIAKMLGERSIAQALVFLDGYPRVDKKYPTVEKYNLERPEVAVIEGILLGYKNCCIEYYVRTRYFNEPRNEESERERQRGKRAEYSGIQCPKCIKFNSA